MIPHYLGCLPGGMEVDCLVGLGIVVSAVAGRRRHFGGAQLHEALQDSPAWRARERPFSGGSSPRMIAV